jgi:hypothetical protein
LHLNPADWPRFLRAFPDATAWYPLSASESADAILCLEAYRLSAEQLAACGLAVDVVNVRAEIHFQAKSRQPVDLPLVAAEYGKLPQATQPPFFTCLLICGLGEIDLPDATPVLANDGMLALRLLR